MKKKVGKIKLIVRQNWNDKEKGIIKETSKAQVNKIVLYKELVTLQRV